MAANNLAYQFKTSSVVVKIITINAVLFLLVSLFSFFFSVPAGYLTRWFVLPSNLEAFLWQPWSLLTYAFLHFDVFHVLFNMIWLYWFGNMVLNLFNAKRFLTIYLLGALFGGLLFVIAYNVFPIFSTQTGYLIGASGAVTAIMIFMATYSPNSEVRIFTFTVKLWHIAAFLFVLDLVRIPTSGNAGGLMAHIGGGVFGYVYALQMAKGNDIGKWFENSIDWVSNLFKPQKKKPFKKVFRTQQNTSPSFQNKANKSDHQKKIDSILDKIGKSGYDSLTKEEKDFLFKSK